MTMYIEIFKVSMCIVDTTFCINMETITFVL